MTALEYMENQRLKHQLDFDREFARNAPKVMLDNIARNISYYEQAVEALRMENILLNESEDV